MVSASGVRPECANELKRSRPILSWKCVVVAAICSQALQMHSLLFCSFVPRTRCDGALQLTQLPSAFIEAHRRSNSITCLGLAIIDQSFRNGYRKQRHMITAAMVGPIHGPACENRQYNSITPDSEKWSDGHFVYSTNASTTWKI